MRGSVAVSVQGFQYTECQTERQTKNGVEFPDEDARDDDERNATFWKDDAGDGSGETIGARDCVGRG